MGDGQNNQSVKDILEDIKNALSEKNTADNEVDTEDENGDVLYLDEEYEEDIGSDESNEDSNDQSEELTYDHDQFNDHTQHSKEENSKEEEGDNYSYSDSQTSGQKIEDDNLQTQNNDHLILKENINDIKVLLGKMQSELHQQQQTRPNDYNLTVEELVMSLLKPELSEWLNKHLYKLVKEVVEKELKDIINNNK